MGKYLVLANYVGEGIGGLLSEGGSSRRAAVDALVESVGGTVESFYYAFGGTDAYVIIDLPDDTTAAALSLAVNATGKVSATVSVLLTAEQMDEAAKKSPAYRPPGG